MKVRKRKRRRREKGREGGKGRGRQGDTEREGNIETDKKTISLMKYCHVT